jgi:hypothetical protein
MSDETFHHPDLDASSTKLWTPDIALRGRLALGTAAALAFGGLGASAALTERAHGQAPGLTPALVLELCSMLPLAGILWSFLGLARGLPSFTVRKNSWCALGVVVLWQLLSVRNASLLPPWGEVVSVIAIAAGLVVLMIVAFSQAKSDGPGSSAESSPGAKAGWGSAGVALLVLLKFGSHFLFKLKFKQETWEAIVLLFLVLCTIGFFLRFAVAKIQLRPQLGTVATVCGAAEILGLIAGGIFVAYVLLSFHETMQRPDFDDKMAEDLNAYWSHVALAVVAGVYLAWSSLTAVFFAILWNRHDSEAEWLRDLRDAEAGR